MNVDKTRLLEAIDRLPDHLLKQVLDFVVGGPCRETSPRGKRSTPTSGTDARTVRGSSFMTIYTSRRGLSQAVIASPAGPSIDSQSVKSAAMVHDVVGYDAGKYLGAIKLQTLVEVEGVKPPA